MSLKLAKTVSVISLLILGAGCGAEDEASDFLARACIDVDPFASEVIEFSPGRDSGFGQEKMPDVVFGPPLPGSPNSGSLDVVSLGVDGVIILGFGERVVADGPGMDLVIWENPFFIDSDPNDPYAELGEVSVSSDGETWLTFPCNPRQSGEFDRGCAGWRPRTDQQICESGTLNVEALGGDQFDLADIGADRVRFIRIRDVSGIDGGIAAGFDLDAVGGLYFHPETTQSMGHKDSQSIDLSRHGRPVRRRAPRGWAAPSVRVARRLGLGLALVFGVLIGPPTQALAVPHVDLELGTELPISVGGTVSAEWPLGIRTSTSLGYLPRAYVSLINEVVQSFPYSYDDETGDLIEETLQRSLIWRAHLGWRGWFGLYFDAGYGLAALGGGTSSQALLAALTGRMGVSRDGQTSEYAVSSVLHMIDAEIGWKIVFSERFTFRTALGVAATISASADVDAQFQSNRPQLVAEFERFSEAYLVDTYETYVISPVITVALGYRLF